MRYTIDLKLTHVDFYTRLFCYIRMLFFIFVSILCFNLIDVDSTPVHNKIRVHHGTTRNEKTNNLERGLDERHDDGFKDVDATGSPTPKPTTMPSEFPLRSPSIFPSMESSYFPTRKPSLHPSPNPSTIPTTNPTGKPSLYSSSYVSLEPLSISNTMILCN